MRKKVSLKDIAQRVGVSTATVSYVLSNDKEDKVSVAVAEKIRKVSKELNYQPNQIAKSLKSGKSNTMGLIVADISNPFFSQIARRIEDEAAKLNYTVIFGSSDEKADKSWSLIQFMLNRQVDGFIIAPTVGFEKQISYLKDQNVPVVLIDRYMPNASTNFVGIDNFQASYKAVRRLIQTGHERIALLAYSSNLPHMTERIRGYQQALKDCHLEYCDHWLKTVPFEEIEQGVNDGITELLQHSEPIDAIFFATNTLAVLGLKRLNELNYIIPTDVSVISFDEGEAFDFFYCPITYIKQPLAEMSSRAVKILVDQIKDPDKDTEHLNLSTELVIQESCGIKEVI